MTYLVGRNIKTGDSITLEVERNKKLAEFTSKLIEQLNDYIEICVLARPTVYGNYEPYRYVYSYEEFETEVFKIQEDSQQDSQQEETIEHEDKEEERNIRAELMDRPLIITKKEDIERLNTFLNSDKPVKPLTPDHVLMEKKKTC